VGTAPETETFASYSTKDGLAKCFLGRTSVVDFLLTRGVDPAAGTSNGLSAFHWAANRGNLDTVKSLHSTERRPLEQRTLRRNGSGARFGPNAWKNPVPLFPAHQRRLVPSVLAARVI